jgi:GntR family transcriptional regulator
VVSQGLSATQGNALNKKRRTPLYYQLKQHLQEHIAAERLQQGDAIPSERELQERFGVSRATVRQAIGELVSEAILERRQGVGTVVARPKIAPELRQLTSFSEDMRIRGVRPGAQLITAEQVAAPPRVREVYGADANTPLWMLYRLRLADDEPLGLQRIFLPPSLPFASAEIKEMESYYQLLERRFGLHLSRAEELLGAKNATEQEAALLRIESGQALLVRERVTFDQYGRPVEFVQFVYRGDRYQYRLPLER